jgi:hypothetical protein
MNVILDTNVLVSGIFFKGPPYRIFQIYKYFASEIPSANGVQHLQHKIAADLEDN